MTSFILFTVFFSSQLNDIITHIEGLLFLNFKAYRLWSALDDFEVNTHVTKKGYYKKVIIILTK